MDTILALQPKIVAKLADGGDFEYTPSSIKINRLCIEELQKRTLCLEILLKIFSTMEEGIQEILKLRAGMAHTARLQDIDISKLINDHNSISRQISQLDEIYSNKLMYQLEDRIRSLTKELGDTKGEEKIGELMHLLTPFKNIHC